MQILQWLFKVTHEQAGQNTSSTSHKKETISDQEAKSTHIILFEHCGVHRRLISKNFKPLKNLCGRDIAKACFYSTLNLKRLGSFNIRQHWGQSMKIKKGDIARGLGIGHKVDSTSHVGNKVLPITETTLSTATKTNDQCGTAEKEDKVKGEKPKTISKMKELLRWAAAAAKSEKGGKFIGRKVLHFRNRGTLKAVPDDDQLSNDSPKISCRWDVESCSTTSSAYYAISMASSTNRTSIQDKDHFTTRKGNWITTDSEFVVLEL